MAIQIQFDHGHNPLPPTIVLANRGGHKYGVLPAVNINLTDSLEEASELQFRVYKYDNGEKCALWDSLVDLKLVWCVEWDVWFEIAVETNDSVEGVYKSVSGKSLGEAELDEIMLYEIEINTEDDIAREDYRVTVLYDAEHPDGSLLDRIREKAPHYSIGHVDASIAGIQRTYTFDNKSLLEALREIGEEVGCLFMIDSGSDSNGRPARIINAYDLKSACNDCGYRGDFTGACPECGSTDVVRGYGDQTNIFVSSDNLASEINFSTNVDAVKSCYRLIGGDDLMTATIANCNPDGTNYIWYINEEMMEDMSPALRARLAQYYATYANYRDVHQTTLNGTIVSQYNALINKYRSYDDSLETVTNPVTGYAPLMKIMYDAIDFELLLSSELMPSPATASTNAATEAAKLTSSALTPVAVSELANCSSATATSAVLSVAKMIVNKGFQVKANNGVLDGEIWEGSFTVTNYSDSEDTATTGIISVTISDGFEDYVSQRLSNLMSDASDDVTDIISLFELSLASFKNELKKYCLERLNSFRDACQACVDLLIEQGIANGKTWASESPNLYSTMYLPYYNKLNALTAEVKVRENEIAIITGVYDANGGLKQDGMESIVERETLAIQKALNLENYLGTALMEEFAAYRREDEYNDDNYISDGLTNAELFERAQEFVDSASAELYRVVNQRCKLSAALSNLLVMKEFEPIVDDFEVGSWISVGADDKVYRLRLASYTVDFDSIDSIDVDFSDEVYALGKNNVLNTIRNAQQMYQSMSKQMKDINATSDQAGQTTAVSGKQGVVVDSGSEPFREYEPYEDEYDDRQLKVVSRGLYITDDDWENVRAGIGDFTYYDPATGETKQGYGVIANVLIAPLILSEDVGVYNEDGTIKLDKNGLTIIYTGDGDNETVFRVQKQIDGATQPVDVIYFDSEGNAHFNGKISASALYGGTLTLGGNNNANGVLQIVNSSGTVIGSWNNSGITINQGSVTANAIKGGTLTLGGSNNTNGVLQIVNSSGTVIGSWNNSGITINQGSVTASAIKGGTLTLGGNNNTNGVLLVLDANGTEVGRFNNAGLSLSQGNINLNSGSQIKIAFDASAQKYALFDSLGMKLKLDSGAEIYTSTYTHRGSSLFPDGVAMGCMVTKYSASSYNLESTIAPGSLTIWRYPSATSQYTYSFNAQIDSISLQKFRSDGGGTSVNFSVDTNITTPLLSWSNNALIGGNLTVAGTKSRKVETDQYADRLLYCYETPTPMFGDVGEGEIGEDGLCYIWLDPVFAQTITTSQYQVFLQPYGQGSCWVERRDGSCFVVSGEPGLKFGWEIKAKQKGYDQRRLERDDTPFAVPEQNYGADAAEYIDELKKGRVTA